MKLKPSLILLFFLVFLLVFSVFITQLKAQEYSLKLPIVLFETNMGNITIQLREDMPITVGNFKNLVREGIYDDTIFHRVVNLPDNLVIIQGGDPTGTGYGDYSIPTIQDEFTTKAEHNKNARATIAMSNTGVPNSGRSQFYINVEYNSHLDNNYPVFGDIIEGMDVVDAISNIETDSDDRPIEEIIITNAEIIQEGSFPTIVNVTQTPSLNGVNYTNTVQIEATVEDTFGLYQVNCSYKIGNDRWNNLTMATYDGNLFFVDLSQFPQDTQITYKIVADNNIRNLSFSEQYQYQVIPEFSSWLILPLFLVVTLFGAIIRKRIRRP